MTKNQNDVMDHLIKREEESIASAKITKESEKYEVEVVPWQIQKYIKIHTLACLGARGVKEVDKCWELIRSTHAAKSNQASK